MSRNKIPLFTFIIFYIFSYIILFLFFILYNFIFLPDVKIWNKKNPKISDLRRLKVESKKPGILRNKINYQWYPIRDIPDLCIKTIILAEDASFWVHSGIDWFEVKESFLKNISKGKFLRGGSTITQQVARNLYLEQEKTINRKMKEWMIAWKLDKELRKRRILEIYLNIAEWGDNIIGIKAACDIYFHKLPSELELHEMIRLAAVLPNPIKMKPNEVNKTVLWRSNVILDRLITYKYIEHEEYVNTKSILENISMVE